MCTRIFWVLLLCGINACSDPVDSTGWKSVTTDSFQSASDTIPIVTFISDGGKVSDPITIKDRKFTKEGKTAYYDTRTDRFTVFCGKTNTDCKLTGSLYIYRVSGNSGKVYKMYMDARMKAKIVYDKD